MDDFSTADFMKLMVRNCLDGDATALSFCLELGVVDVLWIVLLLEFFPLLRLVVDQVTDDLFSSSLLLFAA
jgi:hypothetical protein